MLIIAISITGAFAAEDDKYVTFTTVYNSDGTFWDASKSQYTDGKIYINGNLIESDAPVKFILADDGETVGETFFPLRTIMEGLGANVIWREETKDILIEYKDNTYVANTERLNVSESATRPNDYAFYMKNSQTGELIQLNSMGSAGGYLEVNDRIYLFIDTGEYLLQGLGCQYVIDKEAKTIWITTE